MPGSARRPRGLLALAVLALAAAVLFGLPAGGSAAAPVAPPIDGLAAAPAAPAVDLAGGGAGPLAGTLPQAARVRLGVVGIVAGAGYYLAIEKGYFAEQGLDVDPIPFATTAEETAPLAAGQLDVGAGATSAGLFNAIARGVDVKLVADEGHTEQGRPGNALVVRRAAIDSGQLQGIPDLRGRRIALASTSIGVVSDLRAYLAQGGLTLSDVSLEQLAFPDMAPALGNGSVDAAIVVEPFLTLLQQTGLGTRWLWDYEVNPDHQVAVILYGPGFVREQPDAARRWMTAYLRGVRYFNDAFVRGDAAAREDTVQVLMKWTPIRDRGLYDLMSVIGLDPDGEMRVPSMAADQQLFLELGQQDRPVDFTTAVDTQYVRAARQTLGPY